MEGADRLVAIGGSAGALQALTTLLGTLAPDLPAAVCVVLHQPEGRSSVLTDILDRAGPLPARQAEDGQLLEPGTIHVATPGAHLLCDGRRVRLVGGPLEHGLRPAIDPLFRSAAASFGASAIGVLLSGLLDDGSHGAGILLDSGARVFVQDPADALYPDMPHNAIESLGRERIEAVLPAHRLSGALRSALDAVSAPRPTAETASRESVGRSAARGGDGHREPPLSCPNCAGPLEETAPDDFVCRVGHRWSTETLAANQAYSLEASLWAAVRVLEERAAVCHRMVQRATDKGMRRAARAYEDEIRTVESQAALIRDAMNRDGRPVEVPDAG